MDHQINESQWGFRSNRGCNDQLFNLRILMQRAKEYNTTLYLCFVDISKAYDSVNRNALWKVVRHSYNLPVKIINILKAFHDGTQEVVRFESHMSNEFSIRTGVKQGDMLFNLYLNAIKNSVSETYKHIGAQVMYNLNAPLMNRKDNMDRCSIVQNLLYADDMVVISTNYDDLNCLMETINTRLKMFGLKINIENKKNDDTSETKDTPKNHFQQQFTRKN